MADEGATKATRSGTDDTVPASTPAERSSIPTIPPPPDTRYRLGQELGRGGMGRVVEAFDSHLQRTVALKEVLPSAGNIDRRFQREVRITARLEHASIVPLYDSGRYADGRPFYVMRRVSGKPLDEAIRGARTLEGRLALLPNALAAIDAVAHAHKRGVIHRDLKPQNILVGELGETVVIDWGLAKVLGDGDEPIHDSLEPRIPTAADSLQTQAGSVFGTPGFMPPEQARGDDLGPRSDVYALGATLYQLIVGRPPFAGASATDVIGSTLRHRLEPVARACPAAPPEMVTIIEKALAFEPEDRYGDASELAADVRRFLTGQLVAAHQYTRRQRLARFARRHRAPLVVAALASVGIAALAWVSVNRVLQERDYAERQSVIAREQREQADKRAAQLRERADELLVAHARSLLPTSPTQAIAALKELESTNGRVLEEAKAIGRAAMMRGVAWGLPTLADLVTALEMTRDGKRVLQMTRDGELQIVDLDMRRQIAAYKVPSGGTARWVDADRKVFIDAVDGPPLLFDPVTRAVEPLGVGNTRQFSITADGSRIAVSDDVGLALIDAATKQVVRIPDRTPGSSLEIARDGSWIAFEERVGEKPKQRSRFVVVDVSGKVLAQRDVAVSVLGAGPGNKLAVMLADGLYEVTIGATTTFTSIPFPVADIYRVHQLLYRGDQLLVVSYKSIQAWTGKALVSLHEMRDGSMFVRELGDRMLALTGSDGVITILHDGLSHSVAATQRPDGMMRVAATPGHTRIVATSREALLVWDVAQVFPDRVMAVNNPRFATESLLVSVAGLSPEWSWTTLPDGPKVDAMMPAKPGIPRFAETAIDGRTLLVIERAADRSTAIIGYPNAKGFVIEEVAYGIARLVEGDGFVFSTGKGRVFGKVGSELAREIVTLDGDVQALAPLGKLGFVVLSKKGDLVRAGLDGSKFARTQLPASGDTATVAADQDGSVLVASGNKLMDWSGTSLEDIARVDGRITWLHSVPSGTLIGLAGQQMMFVAATGDRTPRPLDATGRASFAEAGNRVVFVNERSEIEIIELPSLVTWSLPRLYTSTPWLSVSPLGGRIHQSLGHDAALFTIPEPASDFKAWLDGLTNATEDDHRVVWPFSPPL